MKCIIHTILLTKYFPRCPQEVVFTTAFLNQKELYHIVPGWYIWNDDGEQLPGPVGGRGVVVRDPDRLVLSTKQQ